ncbi:MAG TPA: neutral/alkaline non-lysosomal ceramidase N-terminal domain-containing protein [Tepidisphaeraceae bacterium]|nr:neutral/alkaline non-lysosomal ceramidase N-terminal domain-containing protein [Tepidisphaeraceae bacterium]
MGEVDITPGVGGELCGYAARVQPSTGVMGRLYFKAIYIEEGGERFLWMVGDLIAVSREQVLAFRESVKREWGLEGWQVMVSATHTHSGPATIRLNAAGRMEKEYVEMLGEWMREAARQAMARVEECELVVGEGELELAVDRRGHATAQTDPRVLGLGLRRENGTYLGVVVNYAMHPVALGHVNREVSGDWCGYAAESLREGLAGRPVVMVTNGAAGNLNPPGEGMTREEVKRLGMKVAEGVIEGFERPTSNDEHPTSNIIKVVSEVVRMEMEVWTKEEMERVAEREIGKVGAGHPWYGPIREAIESWKRAEKAGVVEIELQVVKLGGVVLVGVNCEMFAQFVKGLREKVGEDVYVVGYTNGAFGYVPHAQAYEEGGYEVDSAHLFYNSFRPRKGSLEMLCERTAELVRLMD